MDLPSYIDLKAIAAIGALALYFIQYIKDAVPLKLVRVATILAGIGMAFLWFYNPQTKIMPDLIVVIANGVLAAIGADGTYNLLSTKNSPLFSFSSKEEVKVEEKKEVGK